MAAGHLDASGQRSARRLHIVHVTAYLAPAWAYGPVPHDVSALARAQAALGHDVLVLTTDACAPHERLPRGETREDDVRIVRVPNLSGVLLTWLGISTPVGMRSHARRLFRERPPGIVHLHRVAGLENLGVLPCVPPAVPVVVSSHGGLANTVTGGQASLRRWDAAISRRVLAWANLLIADSPDDASRTGALCEQLGFGVNDRRIVVVPPGLDRRSTPARGAGGASEWPAVATVVCGLYEGLLRSDAGSSGAETTRLIRQRGEE